MPTTAVRGDADWRRQTTISVPLAARILGVGRNAAYASAARGELPTLRLGYRLVVPVAALRRLLGELPAPDDAGHR